MLSEDTSALVGESVELACVGYGSPQVMRIGWSLNGVEIVADTPQLVVFEEDSTRRGFRQSFLQICNIDNSTIGSYACTVSNGIETVNATTDLSYSGKYVPSLLLACS